MSYNDILNIFIIFCVIFVFFQTMTFLKNYCKSINKKTFSENFAGVDDAKDLNVSNNKYVCIYAYYEKNEEYKNNFEYFLKNGGIINEIDYYIIINGKCSLDIPDRTNIKVLYRENKGYDFGAWQYVIKHHINKPYEYYIFINSSVKGPYSDKNWLDEFLNLFNSGKDVKLVGTTINIFDEGFEGFNLNNETMKIIYDKESPYTHVQSMFFIIDKEAFDFLYKKGFFDDEEKLSNFGHINNVIIYKEIMMSQMIIKNGWNINCILPKYRDLDYRNIKQNINPSGCDPYWPETYFGNTIQPEDVIFYKGYRLKT